MPAKILQAFPAPRRSQGGVPEFNLLRQEGTHAYGERGWNPAVQRSPGDLILPKTRIGEGEREGSPKGGTKSRPRFLVRVTEALTMTLGPGHGVLSRQPV
jgi:hypothetical protein